MTLRASLHEVDRALERPVENAHRRWTARAAYILTLESETGRCGFGEASPLPGFSPDTLADCHVALSTMDVSDLPARLETGRSLAEALRDASARLPRELPAARCAFESALLDLWARDAGRPAWSLLCAPNSEPPAPRAVCALLMDSPERALAEARAAQARGIQSFKFKVGRPAALERELDAIRELCAALGPECNVRLDANRALSRDAARQLLEASKALHLEFVEEPCSISDCLAFAAADLPVALDESLSELDAQSAAAAELVHAVKAVVLKPTLLGGVTECLAWAQLAERESVAVILSHAFEGPLGLALSAALALSVGSRTFAHGLDLAGARIEQERLPFSHGAQIVPWAAPGLGVEEPRA